MLAAIIRRVVANPRSCLATVHYSTASPPPLIPIDHSELENILKEEGTKQRQPEQKFTSANHDRPSRKWKPFKPGQFVTPRQLTYQYRQKPTIRSRPPMVGPSTAEARSKDVFYKLGIDPLDHCMNPALLSSFVSEMGKIYGRNITKLTTKNQRRMGKAIRRAKMMGVMPILSRPKPQWWGHRL